MTRFFLKSVAVGGFLAIALSPCASAGGPFAGPKEGPPSFRRDRIPLEVADMRRLSDSLATMSTVIKDERAEDRRLAAQCIALSLALEPGNRDARRLLSAWEDGRYRTNENFDDARKALKFAAGLIDWLESDTAGRDAKKLADCLRDVVSRVGARDTEFSQLGGEQLIGYWNDFVPALSAYEKLSEPVDPSPVPDPNPTPLPDPSKKDFKLAFERAEITIPMWYRAIKPEEGQEWVLKPGRMFVTAGYDPGRKNEPFSMQVGGDMYNEQMRNLTNSISGVLHQAMGGLPGGLRVAISSEALEEALRSGQPQSISAAAVVLAGSVVRGLPPNSDTIVVGKVDQNGNYLPSSDMWEKLKAFGNGKGQRLVVPAKSRQYFEAMLTMDQIKYFLDYEVVVASNVQELLNATAAQPEGALGEATLQFAEIQKVAPNTNVRGFIANSHVRKRLQEVVKACPQHLSGELLLMQANSSRPFNISREVLCAEMKSILKPLEQVKAIPWDNAAERNFRRLDVAQIAKDCSAKVAALERYVGREERDLYQAVDAVFDEMREYDKALNTKGEYEYITGLLVRASRSAQDVVDNYARKLDEAMNR